MKKLLLILLVTFIAATGVFANGDNESGNNTQVAVNTNALEDAANAYFADMPGSRIIKSEDLFVKMDAGEDMLILDIRKADAYEKSHLKGA
ncbi:MAG: hypothetical protein DRP58_10875, partial [Spirochaetes bacterium]